MADDFATTADRMMQDARILHDAGAHRNACYLAGYVVECTLKALLAKAGETLRVHDLESLHDKVTRLLMNGSAVLARYGDPSQFAPTMLHQVNPPTVKRSETRYYCHWDPEHRYDGTRWTLSSVSVDYLREAEKAHDVIVRMFVDGEVVL